MDIKNIPVLPDADGQGFHIVWSEDDIGWAGDWDNVLSTFREQNRSETFLARKGKRDRVDYRPAFTWNIPPR